MKTLKFVAIEALIVAQVFAVAASAQTTSEATSKAAASAWMSTPTPYLDWNKDISASARAERNKFWDEASMSPVPLTQPGSGRVVGGSYDMAWDRFEISDVVKDRAVLTATFTGHRSVLTSSERSLYTEVTLRVDQVFEDRTGTGHPTANHDVTLILYGGTVILRNSQAFSVDNPGAQSELFIQPEHKYLFVLRYENAGDFYTLVDDWDISDGTVRANSVRAQFFVQEHTSALNGLTVEQLGPALDKLLYGHK
jgi:hypothetical protein